MAFRAASTLFRNICRGGTTAAGTTWSTASASASASASAASAARSATATAAAASRTRAADRVSRIPLDGFGNLAPQADSASRSSISATGGRKEGSSRWLAPASGNLSSGSASRRRRSSLPGSPRESRFVMRKRVGGPVTRSKYAVSEESLQATTVFVVSRSGRTVERIPW